MKVEKWNAKEIFQGYIDKAESNANVVMDEVVVEARRRLMAGITQRPPIVRQGGFRSASIEFVPKKGRNKDKVVRFYTDKQWTGRRTSDLDQLYGSIRRVNRGGSGSVRAYVGNALAYWALMVEKTGYTDRGGQKHAPLHFLQGSFHAMKKDMLRKVAKE